MKFPENGCVHSQNNLYTQQGCLHFLFAKDYGYYERL